MAALASLANITQDLDYVHAKNASTAPIDRRVVFHGCIF